MTTNEELKARHEAVAKEIFQLVNYFGGEDKLATAITKELLHEHRTLQANFIRTIRTIVKEYAEKATTDERNDDAKAWAHIATEATEDVVIRHI